jgi:hypothetical protein
MNIPVYVQPPNQPQKGRLVGHADSELAPEEVVAQLGIPDEGAIDGKVVRRNKAQRWVFVVADIRFRER